MRHRPQAPNKDTLPVNAPALWIDYDEFDQPTYRAMVISHTGVDERFESGDVVGDFTAAQRRFADLGGRIVLSSFFDFFRDGQAWDLASDGSPSTWVVAPGPAPWRPLAAPVVFSAHP